jgi:MFS superfamily sulfate permease-like transporter
MMSASLLVTLGCSFLVSELTDAIQCLKKQEFALVLVHLAVTIYFGMLYAVLSGLLFSMLIFIVDYVSHSGVVQSATSELKRSTVVRTNEEWDFLAEHGASTLIIHLQGMAFFGSASQVTDGNRAHCLMSASPMAC